MTAMSETLNRGMRPVSVLLSALSARAGADDDCMIVKKDDNEYKDRKCEARGKSVRTNGSIMPV